MKNTTRLAFNININWTLMNHYWDTKADFFYFFFTVTVKKWRCEVAPTTFVWNWMSVFKMATCWPARCFTSTFPQPLSASPWKPAAALGSFYWTTCSLWSHGPRLFENYGEIEHVWKLITQYRALNPLQHTSSLRLNSTQCSAVTESPNNRPGVMNFSVRFAVLGRTDIESHWYTLYK